MPPGFLSAGSLRDLAAAGLDATMPPPPDLRAGFDAVIQFSQRLLSAELSRSLRDRGLSPLTATQPWDAAAVPAALLAALPAAAQVGLPPTTLELRCVDPQVAALRWPAPPITTDAGGVATMAHGLPGRFQRNVDVAWRLEVNAVTVRGFAPDPGGGPVPAPRIARSALATGTLTTTARASVETDASRLFAFGALDFTGATWTTTFAAPAAADFVASGAGAALLSSALAPLLAADGVGLTPVFAPGGPLPAAVVQAVGAPPLHATDVLLSDSHGAPVLCLCVSLGQGNGAQALVRPFVEGLDFAWAASARLLAPALKARWKVLAPRLATFEGDVAVELPVGDGPETATGRARVRVVLGPELQGLHLVASLGGDTVTLDATQTVRLLGLWDHAGKAVDIQGATDPQTGPFAIPLRLFGSGPAPAALTPWFDDLVARLAVVLLAPVRLRYPFIGIGGRTSAPTDTLLARWRLRRPQDDIVSATAAGAGAMEVA